MKIESNITIDAPPDRVYSVVMDPDCLERWVTIHRGLKDAPNGDLEAGSELVQRLALAGRPFTVKWRVTEVDRPSLVVWEGRGPVGTKAAIRYELEQDGGGTRFSYVNEYELRGGIAGRLAGRAISRVAARESERSLERLKTLLEE